MLIVRSGVAVSSFYSLHRPIHVNSTFVPVDSTSAVNAFLDQGDLRGPVSNPSNVINTLGSIVKALGGNPNHMENSPEGDQAALQSLINGHVSRLNPFQVPHPPVPMDVDRSKPFHDLQATQRQGRPSSKDGAVEVDSQDGGRLMTATLVLSGGDEPGETVEYEMSIPLSLADRLDPAELEGGHSEGLDTTGQPFMRRLLARALQAATSSAATADEGSSSSLSSSSSFDLEQEADAVASHSPASASSAALRHRLWQNRIRHRHSQRVQMQLISVKRRRRLKIKKHKYKKLLKRTRTLRRKLDQL